MAQRRMYFAAFAALLYAVVVGITATYSSTATVNMNSTTSAFIPSESEVSWIGSIIAPGALFGGLIAGYLAEKFGRKCILMFTSVPFVTGWLFIAFAHSLIPILIGRFITGICCGLICVVTPIYIVEISGPKERGKFGSAFQLFITFGVLLVSILGICITWNWLAISGAICVTFPVLLMYYMPESPRWLVAHKRISAAVAAIKFLNGTAVNAEHECGLLIQNINSESSISFSFLEFKKPTIYMPMLLSIGLMFFQQFSGSNAILFNSVSIFQKVEKDIDPGKANISVALTMVFFTFLSSCFMDLCGRKKFLFLSSIFTMLSLIALGAFSYVAGDSSSLKEKYGWIPLLCVVIFIAAFSVGLGPIPWLMMAEMSPMHVRSVICGFGTAMSWLFVFIVTKSFISLQNLLSDYATYWIYATFCLGCCFFTFFIPETKGKTLEEISNSFLKEPEMTRMESDDDDLTTVP